MKNQHASEVNITDRENVESTLCQDQDMLKNRNFERELYPFSMLSCSKIILLLFLRGKVLKIYILQVTKSCWTLNGS